MTQPYMHHHSSVLAGLMLSASLMLTGCFGSDPEVTAEQFYKAVASGAEVETVMEFVHLDDSTREQVKAGLTQALPPIQAAIKDKGGLLRLDTVEKTVAEDYARLRSRLTYKNGSSDVKNMVLNKVDSGRWKIILE